MTKFPSRVDWHFLNYQNRNTGRKKTWLHSFRVWGTNFSFRVYCILYAFLLLCAHIRPLWSHAVPQILTYSSCWWSSNIYFQAKSLKSMLKYRLYLPISHSYMFLLLFLFYKSYKIHSNFLCTCFCFPHCNINTVSLLGS